MSNQLNTDTDLMNDKLVTMAFITTFTKPIKLGRSSRWRESEVKRWLTERIEESRY